MCPYTTKKKLKRCNSLLLMFFFHEILPNGELPMAFLHNFVKFKDFKASNFPKFEPLDVGFVMLSRK
jgi:hypothetical protein